MVNLARGCTVVLMLHTKCESAVKTFCRHFQASKRSGRHFLVGKRHCCPPFRIQMCGLQGCLLPSRKFWRCMGGRACWRRRSRRFPSRLSALTPPRRRCWNIVASSGQLLYFVACKQLTCFDSASAFFTSSAFVDPLMVDLWCTIPAEVRNSRDVRRCAEEALQKMVPSQLMRAAVTCDYSSECLAFLRSNFDIDNPDPAGIFQAFKDFHSRMTALFVEGFILGDAAAVHSPQSMDGSLPKTACQLVFEEIEIPEPILWLSLSFANVENLPSFNNMNFKYAFSPFSLAGSTMVIEFTIFALLRRLQTSEWWWATLPMSCKLC